jgi:hypothetical protein
VDRATRLGSSATTAAGARDPNFVPLSTLSFLKRYRNECASVEEFNFVWAPFSTPVFLIRQRRTTSPTLVPSLNLLT